MAATQSEVKALLDGWSQSTRSRDIDRLMSLYAPDITYFDCVPIDQTWLIAHEHISLPIDFKSRSAVMDLVP